MKQSEIISAISALSAAIKANVGHDLGDEDVIMMANAQLKYLIPKINIEGKVCTINGKPFLVGPKVKVQTIKKKLK